MIEKATEELLVIQNKLQLSLGGLGKACIKKSKQEGNKTMQEKKQMSSDKPTHNTESIVNNYC